jgi:hypothetical protein
MENLAEIIFELGEIESALILLQTGLLNILQHRMFVNIQV